MASHSAEVPAVQHDGRPEDQPIGNARANIAESRTSPSVAMPLAQSPSGDRTTTNYPLLTAGRPHFQEIDLWWGSYSGRVMLPSFLLCGLATAGVVWAAFAIWDEGLARDPVRHGFYALVGGLWLVQLIRWGYRVSAYHYRLTTRRLFLLRGFLYPLDPAIELDRVASVRTEQSFLDRLLGTGSIRIILEDRSLPPTLLRAVRDPHPIAEAIQKQAAKAREENVMAVRV